MKKNDRITAYVASLVADPSGGWDPRYEGYFLCFNRGEFYEAHDVLEDLWLQTTDTNYGFYKGLIQLAGAFVHLRKQALRPDHPKDGRRLGPAARLFALSRVNLEPFAPWHLGVNVAAVLAASAQYREQIIASGYTENPWNPEQPPHLELHPADGSIEKSSAR